MHNTKVKSKVQVADVCLWHLMDGPTFEVAFYKWARFDSKRSTKVCAADIYNSMPVHHSAKREIQICNGKAQIKVKLKYEA